MGLEKYFVTNAISNELRQKISDFEELISIPTKNENAIQAFLEANTTFMPTPDLLGHRLHLNSVIAKFPVGERSTDYAYLTKTSIEWQLVLVELEDSGKRIFKPSSKDLAFTSEFGNAIAQIDVWRDYASQHLDRLRDKLRPLMVPQPMAHHRLSVRYVLVIGRSEEIEHHEARKLRLANYGAERDLRIMTYDTLLREVAAGHSRPKAVLRANSRGYLLQSAEGMPAHMFADIMPAQLELSGPAEASLRAETYDIDAWKRNEPLNFNEKWTRTSEPARYDSMHPAVKNIMAIQKKPKDGNHSD